MSVQDMGIKNADRKRVAQGLTRILASTYMVYVKTHNYHWNVTGPLFQPLHGVFEEQYTHLAEDVDEIAERIRSLGFRAPGTFQEFLKLSHIQEDAADIVPEAEDMLANLQQDHETISSAGRKLIELADQGDDKATADLITKQLEFHEKTAWMLRSFLTPSQNVTSAMSAQSLHSAN
ncbi:MAG: DNA starvation/stationary phase protection protein [Bdellovibrionota bacterium]